MMRLRDLFLLALFSAVMLPGVATRSVASPREEPPQLCAAIRGNGELALAHVSSLARLTEHFGLFDGLAGGSSASVTSFLYESLLQNPALRDCAGCGPRELALRGALLLKTIWAYVDVIRGSEEVTALVGFAETARRLAAELKARGLDASLAALPPAELDIFARRFEALLAYSELRTLINPELIEMIRAPAPRTVKIRQLEEARAAVETFGRFQADDRRIFFRPGLISFERLAFYFGRIGNFLAGRGGPRVQRLGEMKAYLDRCAPLSAGLDWEELSAAQPECAAAAHELIVGYRARIRPATRHRDLPDSRLADPVGAFAHVLVTTTVLEDAEADLFREGLRRYRAGESLDDFEFTPFSQLKIGYWGQQSDLDKLLANPRGYSDLKTSKRVSLGRVTWAFALARSPAEPGLSRALAIDGSDGISAGGWGDLAPVLALKSVGCKRVIYVNRQGGDSKFARGLARNLGMNDEQDSALYALDHPQSSLASSIAEADAVWCTQWDAFSPFTQLKELGRDSWTAPLESRADLAREGFPTYGPQTRPLHAGCGALP